MARSILFILFTSLSVNAYNLRIVPAEKATKHLGETVKIVDRVYSNVTNDKETVLKIGSSLNHQYLTVVIKSDDKDKIKYLGYNIYVTGKLVKYKGEAAIVVNNPKQIGIVMIDHNGLPAFN